MKTLALWLLLQLTAHTEATSTPAVRMIRVDFDAVQQRILVDDKPTHIHYDPNWAYTNFDVTTWFEGDTHNANKAPIEFILNVPQGFSAVASGHLIKKTPLLKDRVEFIFLEDKPYSPYLYGFAVGRFKHVARTINHWRNGRFRIKLIRKSLFPMMRPKKNRDLL